MRTTSPGVQVQFVHLFLHYYTILSSFSSSFSSFLFPAAGYLDVGAGKHLHYMLSESEKAPAKDPLVFWFNGGPGCSSLDGFFYEHGAFHVTEPIVNSTGGVPSLYLNPVR